MKRKAIALSLGIASEGLFTAVCARGIGPCGPTGALSTIWLVAHIPAFVLMQALHLNDSLAIVAGFALSAFAFASLWYIALLKPVREP
jgi:hypothetical protein